MIKKIVVGTRAFRRPSVVYCSNNGLLPEVFARTPAAKLRKQLLLPESSHETQLNQDIFALLVNRFEAGFFLDIGANDGFTLSNTVYLEEKFGWNGLLVEANPQYQDNLKKRKSKSVISAVVEKDGYYQFYNAGLYGGLVEYIDKKHEKCWEKSNSIMVWGTTLKWILEEHGAPPIINFVSIDVEGAEIAIVKQMCELKKYRFACGCIEHNQRHEDYQQITRLIQEAGYRIVWEGQTLHDLFFIDERGSANIG